MSELPKNVERGVELLDREYPQWRDHIDPDTLDMESCFHCIVGQLHGSYDYGLARLGVSASGARYGFATWGSQRWDNLTEAWRKVLRRV